MRERRARNRVSSEGRSVFRGDFPRVAGVPPAPLPPLPSFSVCIRPHHPRHPDPPSNGVMTEQLPSHEDDRTSVISVVECAGGGKDRRVDMCGIMQSGICRFTELTPGQFGLTKQLVLRIALPHVSIFVVAVAYAVLGSWLLTAIRYSDGTVDIVESLDKAKWTFTSQLMRLRRRVTSVNEAENFFDGFTDALYETFQQFPKSPAVVRNIQRGAFHGGHHDLTTNVTWNLFFAVTTLTSIGYGANAPDTAFGRLFIVGYVLFGIPLYLITMADLAKFCTEGMNRTYTEYLKYKFHLRRRYKRWKSGRKASVHIGEIIIAGGEDEVAEFLWTHLENTHFVEVPFALIYMSLAIYVVLASYSISRFEGWTDYDGFYFVMMSVLTVGFGDLVPSNDSFILVTLLIILVGLVLTTTCIDVVGAYYIDRLHFFGRRIETQDPLAWLKAVQQKRIEAMKREAMKKLFETVAALHHMHFDMKRLPSSMVTFQSDADSVDAIRLTDPPQPPRGIVALNATAESVALKWEPPVYVDEGKRYWYTLTYKTRTPQRRNNPVTVVDFINTDNFEVSGLRSFTLYEFSVATTTRYGSSKAVRCQEYTEPCTVPQLLRLDAVSSESASFSWRAPRKNNGPQSYVVQFAQEPAPQFHHWTRYSCGSTRRFTITDLRPDTRYIMCVSAEHNFGLAAMSKSVRFKTKRWWLEEESGFVASSTVAVCEREDGDVDRVSSYSALR